MDEDTNLQPQNGSDGAQILINLESMIKSHIASVERLSEELKKHKGMLNDIFENDSTYKQHSEAAKEAARIKSQTKQQILKAPQVADLANKVKSMQSQLKETREALSDYLREFQRMSGVNEIEDETGEVHEIRYVAKLVKKRAGFPQ
jgi:predicted RNase H-like nuclease (RuvC/YqgF family)